MRIPFNEVEKMKKPNPEYKGDSGPKRCTRVSVWGAIRGWMSDEFERRRFLVIPSFEAGDVARLAEPVPCRGAQGLWTLPEDVEAKVMGQVWQ